MSDEATSEGSGGRGHRSQRRGATNIGISISIGIGFGLGFAAVLAAMPSAPHEPNTPTDTGWREVALLQSDEKSRWATRVSIDRYLQDDEADATPTSLPPGSTVARRERLPS